MGADLSRVIICKARAWWTQDGHRSVHPMSLQDHSYWRAVFARFPETKLFIGGPDPVLPGAGVNDRQNSEIRVVLEPFIDDVIRPAGSASTPTRTSRRASTPGRPSKRSRARSPTPTSPGTSTSSSATRITRGRRIFSQVKCNNSPDDLPAIVYSIARNQIAADDGSAIETAIPLFEESPLRGFDLADMMAGNNKRGAEADQSSKVAQWLWERLEGAGQVFLSALIDEAREAGLLASVTDKNPKRSISPLYAAAERLELMHPGYQVVTEEVKSVMSGATRKSWRLAAVEGVRHPWESDDEDDEDPIRATKRSRFSDQTVTFYPFTHLWGSIDAIL